MSPPLLARYALILLVIAFLLAPWPGRAEVSVELDDSGNYVGYHLLTNNSAKKSKVWSFQREGKKGIVPLNVEGDARGDGVPLIEENLQGNGLPWVLWERSIGADRKLVSSRWTVAGWSEESEIDASVGGSQRQPDLAFNSQGRAYAGFVRERPDGTGEVRFSIFLFSRWAYSIPVSDDYHDASAPTLDIIDDRTVEVTFTLSDGTEVTRTVHLPDTSTIHDDIYPFLQEQANVTEGMIG